MTAIWTPSRELWTPRKPSLLRKVTDWVRMATAGQTLLNSSGQTAMNSSGQELVYDTGGCGCCTDCCATTSVSPNVLGFDTSNTGAATITVTNSGTTSCTLSITVFGNVSVSTSSLTVGPTSNATFTVYALTAPGVEIDYVYISSGSTVCQTIPVQRGCPAASSLPSSVHIDFNWPSISGNCTGYTYSGGGYANQSVTVPAVTGSSYMYEYSSTNATVFVGMQCFTSSGILFWEVTMNIGPSAYTCNSTTDITIAGNLSWTQGGPSGSAPTYAPGISGCCNAFTDVVSFTVT